MPENTRLSGIINQLELLFVERGATPRLLMKLGIQLHLAGLSLSSTVLFLRYLVSNVLDRRFIVRLTKSIYSLKVGGVGITLWLTRL